MTPPINPNPLAATLSEPKPEEKEPVCKCGLVRSEHDRFHNHKFQDSGIPDASKAGVDSPPQNALLPCPFCKDCHVTVSEYDTQDAWWTQCDNIYCGAAGPTRKTKQEAIAAWNQRVVPSVVAGVEEKECCLCDFPASAHCCPTNITTQYKPRDFGEPRGELAAAHVLQKVRQLLLSAKAMLAAAHFCHKQHAQRNDPLPVNLLELRQWDTDVDEAEKAILSSPSNAVLPPPVSENPSGLTKLNSRQQELIKEWAADSPHGELFGNEEARAINLATFARSILNASVSQSPSSPVGSTATGVEEEEIAREEAAHLESDIRRLNGVIFLGNLIYPSILTAIRKAKSTDSLQVLKTAIALMRVCYDEANRIANHCSDGAARQAMHYLYEAANAAKRELAPSVRAAGLARTDLVFCSEDPVPSLSEPKELEEEKKSL